MQGWFGLSLLSIIDTHPLMMIVIISVNATAIIHILFLLYNNQHSTIVDINHDNVVLYSVIKP